MNNLVEFKNLSFSYKDHEEPILKNINFTLKQGDLAGIIGRNGAGKTTFIKLILGLLDSGKQVKSKVMAKDIGYVSQILRDSAMNFPATSLEIVMLDALNCYKDKKLCKKKAIESLKMVKMEDQKNKLIKDLSGGQRQKVMIAKAISKNPSLLVLDEPTSGVDQGASYEIYDLIKELNKMGMTIVIISHDLKNIERIATSLYEIEYGKLIKLK